ncbi:sister chromatid cohesion protein PDS5 homolog C isoform X2 [Raphanus sativus]|uniref:Sister chromatid cohesion protein PDS5 homolog C isoform X2 n=1 Tax=Raphanus sativus TaxID=3726 RepID=A0A9W3CJL6_RAPSA|nr:sister chromatid cohesion protein PDS5 homolog C isoform X2 [Raphanus sativus]
MSDSEKEIENQILEAGEKLIDPPSSLDELLSLLDKIFTCLVDVEQSPPASMQNALSPLMTALVDGKLVKHSDTDVKVSVAACISEITRITAPDAPYDDDQMKEVFKLIVSSFENLDDDSSRSYSKRTSILETVAKVRSCVVMLDLECDSLLIEMFQNFLKAVRDHHKGNLFSSMENIMTLVLEESEEIPTKMLSPILHYVRKDDEVPQVSRTLAEQVLSKCASKLKNYLTEAVKSSGVSLDKYSKIVASICEGTFSALQQDQLVENEKEDSQGPSTKEAEVEDKQEAEVISTPERTDPPKDESIKSGVSNGIAQQNDSSVDTESTKKLDDTNAEDEPEQLDSNTGLDDTSEKKAAVEHQTQEEEPSSVKQVESSKSPDIKEDTEPEALLDSKDVQSLPPDDSSVNAAASENDKDTSVQAEPPKTSADETANVSSPSKPDEEIQPETTANQKKKEGSTKEAKPSKTSADETANVSSPSKAEDLVEEIQPKTTANQKKNESSTKEAKPSAVSATEEASEETKTSKAKMTKKSGKKVASSSKAKSTVSPSKKSASETKAAKQSEKKAVESDNVQESSKPKVEKKKPGRGKAMDDTSSGDSEKPAVSSGKSASKSKKEVKEPIEESPNTSSKRKRSLGTEKKKASDLQNPDGNIVGSRVRVWWPIDKAYYKGVVDSYDSAKKRHLVIYDDGDQEILNLKKQKWHFLDESETEGEEAAEEEASTEPQSKKAKTGKQTKIGSSGKKGGGAGSSKSKATPASKSGKKSQDDKSESKPKDSKAAKGKAKSTPASKSKESDVESESEETPKAPEPATKGKSVGSGKSQASQSKSGKKRKR